MKGYKALTAVRDMDARFLDEANVKACDYNSSRQEVYDAERYRVALSGGGYSSDYYYDGYLPWRSNAVAYWMFCDFWSYTYPGVSSYT
ncbi:MAG: hypothetical protein IK082_04775 [Oscillospiraceae bacterium]|nr:hypothetical protein [Oscillospiraceae bacterium]